MRYPNKIKDLLFDRSQAQFANEMGVSRQLMNTWIQGKYKPRKFAMAVFLKVLGEPCGRVLEEKEVWPE